MTAIETYLKEEIKKADHLVDRALETTLALQAERNKKRKEDRAKKSKRSRKRAPKDDHKPVALPERIYAYQAFARQKICGYLLAQLPRLEAGEVDQVLAVAAKAKVHIGTVRQNAQLRQHWLACIEDLRAWFSRRKTPAPSLEVEGWNEGRIQAMLELRVKASEKGLAILDRHTLSDPIAITLHLREYARLLVARRFHTSHHLCDAQRLKQVAPTIRLELPAELIKAYGEAGKEAWREAVDDFVREMLIIHQVAA